MKLRFHAVLVIVVVLATVILGIDQLVAKKAFIEEEANVTIIHRNTQETDILRAITTKERIVCPLSLLNRFGFGSTDDPARPQPTTTPPECFKFEGVGVVLQESESLCVDGTEDGQTCATDKDADACRAGGGECEAVTVLASMESEGCAQFNRHIIDVQTGLEVGDRRCVPSNQPCVCVCGIETTLGGGRSQPDGTETIPRRQCDPGTFITGVP